MGIGTTLYNILLLLHIGTAIAGFGGMIANSAFRSQAQKASSGADAIWSASNTVARSAEYAVYALLVLGIALVVVSDGAISMGDPWISASFLVWILVVAAIHALVRPAAKALAAGEAEASSAANKLRLGEGAVQLLLAAALVLMIWQPS